jgi:hypothetical protein
MSRFHKRKDALNFICVLGIARHRGALAKALASVGRARVPVTVRIHTVILGPSSGGQGPNKASPDQITGEVIIDGVARPLRATTSYYPMAVDQALVEESNRDRVSTAGAGLRLLGGSRSLKSLRSSAELIALPGSRYDHKIDSTQQFVAWGKRPSSADAWLAFYGGPRAKR